MLIDSYYPELTSSSAPITSTYWVGQTFTASQNYDIGSIILKMWKGIGSTPGTITISIKDTDISNKPTGVDLTSGTISGNDLPESLALCESRTITFSDPVSLSNGSIYAVIVKCESPEIYLVGQNDSTYSEGSYTYSSNSGSTWSLIPNSDRWFETYSYNGANLSGSIDGVSVFSGNLLNTFSVSGSINGVSTFAATLTEYQSSSVVPNTDLTYNIRVVVINNNRVYIESL